MTETGRGSSLRSSGVPNDVGFANPMIAAGDLIVGGALGAPQRLAVGGNGKVLTVIGGVPAWPPDAAAGVDAVAVSQTVVAPLSRGAGASASIAFAVGAPHASDNVLQVATTILTVSYGQVVERLDQNAGTGFTVSNQTAGVAAFAQYTASAPASNLEMYAFGNAWTTAGFFIQSSGLMVASGAAGLVLAANNGAGTIRFYTQGINLSWTMRNPTAIISEFVSGTATARIIGGATNGLAIRNSANTRDNLLIADNGSVMTLTDGVSVSQIVPGGASGEITAGARYSSTAGTWLNNNGAAGIIGIAYNDTVAAQYRSAVEVATAAGFSVLKLMRSGGQVTINDGSAGTASALYVKGNAYGAGVASIRVDGLTNGAAAAAGTLLNAPAAGNPTFWMPFNVAGVVKFIPCW